MIGRTRRQLWPEALPDGQLAMLAGVPQRLRRMLLPDPADDFIDAQNAPDVAAAARQVYGAGGQGETLGNTSRLRSLPPIRYSDDAGGQPPFPPPLRPRTALTAAEVLPADQDPLAPALLPAPYVDAGTAPLIDTRRGRPHRIAASLTPDDQLAQQEQYRAQVEDFEPRTESKKMTALRMALGFIGGGVPGAVVPLLDRRSSDRRWQVNELANTDLAIERLGERRRNSLRDQLTEAQIGETQAQAIQRLRTKPIAETVDYNGYQIPQSEAARLRQERELAERRPKPYRAPLRQADEAGNVYLADPDTGEPLRDAQGNVRYASRAKPEAEAGDVPDTSQQFAALEQSHRTNAANAQKAAETAESQYRAYLTSQRAANPQFDERYDPDAQALQGEAKRQRDYAAEQLKAADAVARQKAQAAATDQRARSKSTRRRSSSRPTRTLTDAQKSAIRAEAIKRGLDPEEALRRALVF